MGLARNLSVITPVSRPELLLIVALSVPDEAEWVLVTDGPLEIPRGLRPHVFIEGPKTGQWGDVQRQIGLEAATRPFVYFLDDDNMMLPDLADLLIPYLENGNHAGVLFALLIHLSDKSYLWPPPVTVQAGRVDTAMFFGHRNAALEVRFQEPGYGRGWPDRQGQRGADYIFLEAFEDHVGLSRLPALYGFHNAVDLIKDLEPDFYADLEAHRFNPSTLSKILNRYMIKADVPPWW